MSSEAWEIVDEELQISRLVVYPATSGSQQDHIDARSVLMVSRWQRMVSVARHYYRLRRVMGIIGTFLKENKQDATDELLEQFPEIDPKRAAKLAKRKARLADRKRSPHPPKAPKAKAKQAAVVPKSRGSSSRSSRQTVISESSVPDEVISVASIENSHYE